MKIIIFVIKLLQWKYTFNLIHQILKNIIQEIEVLINRGSDLW